MSDPVALLAQQQKQEYSRYVERLTTQVIAALPLTVADEQLKRARARFRVAFSADAQGALLDCTGESIARAIVMSALSGLFPGGPKPDVWLIPRHNKHRGLEVNWQLSFRGYIRLARRAGWDLDPVLVFQGEKFQVHEGSEPSIVHERDLDVEQTWETLRYAYVRVYPEGKRDQSKIAYLNKAQILQRRRKAETDAIWKEWPLEMALKTICNYAGNREMFPVDDPARYAIDASEQAELGGGSPVSLGATEGGERLLEAPSQNGAVIDLSASPEPELVETVPEEEDALVKALKASLAAAASPAPPPTPEPPNGAPELDTKAMLDKVGALLTSHCGDDMERRKDALEAAFGTRDRRVVARLPPSEMAVGLAALERHLEGLAAMAAGTPP